MGLGQGARGDHLTHPLAPVGPAEIFTLYQAARPRLPAPPRRGAARRLSDLGALADRFDLFLLDAFGVLNIGEAAIPGAVQRIAALRAAGKRVKVVTNAAGYPKRFLLERYRRLGFDFAPEEVVSSRETLLAALSGEAPRRWGVMAEARWGREELDGIAAHFLDDDPARHDAAEGFLLLGSGGWTPGRQETLKNSLKRHPRPVLVGNPDIVAPRQGGYSFEPGHYAHELAEIDGVEPVFFGKPFGNVFAKALARDRGVVARAVMVGDTLHTDILGGLAAGLSVVLITDTGSIHRGRVEEQIAASGICPDYLAPRI